MPILQVLASSGEALPAEIATQWRNRIRLINAYGPTETIVCTIQELSGNELDIACIGLALPGLEINLLVPKFEETVPEGQEVEICVAGPQLFRGYVSIDNAKARECYRNGKKFYRAGDMGIIETTAPGKSRFI